MPRLNCLHHTRGRVLCLAGLLLLLSVLVLLGRTLLLEWRSSRLVAFQGFADTNALATWPELNFIEIRRPNDYTDESLAGKLRHKLSPEELSLVVNPIKSTPAMDAWARELTAGATNDLQKARSIYNALATHHTDKEIVPSRHLRTASEIFAAWDAPGSSFICQEFTYLYIALARASGLKAYEAFVEEDCYGNWNYHSCTAVFIAGKALLADPVYSWFGAPHKRFTLLEDIQTEAVYLCEWHGVKECRTARKLAPGLSIVQACLFVSVERELRWGEAREQAVVMARQFPGSPATLHDQAVVAFHDGKPAQAIELVRKAVKMAPQDSDNYNLLGNIYAQHGNPGKAREEWQYALRYAPNEAAAESFRRCMASMEAWEFCNRGYAEAIAGNSDAAFTNYTRAIELAPQWAVAYAYRAEAEQQIGDLSAALADDAKAIQLQPDYAWAYESLGKIYESQRKVIEARDAFQNALRYSSKPDMEAVEGLKRLAGSF
jgi:tetratricopeptide (TPR) repeat protein